jgi:hypothetical protein
VGKSSGEAGRKPKAQRCVAQTWGDLEVANGQSRIGTSTTGEQNVVLDESILSVVENV